MALCVLPFPISLVLDFARTTLLLPLPLLLLVFHFSQLPAGPTRPAPLGKGTPTPCLCNEMFRKAALKRTSCHSKCVLARLSDWQFHF